MKTTIVILTLISISILFASCKNRLRGKGPTVTQEFFESGFSKVSLDFEADVIYQHAANHRVVLEAQQNVIDRMEIEVTGQTLNLAFKRRTRLVKYEPITVTISSPNFTGCTINGSGNVDVTEGFENLGIDVNVSGSGSVNLQHVQAKNCLLDISGSGHIVGNSGNLEVLDCTISGSGKINFAGVEAEKVITNTSGSGNTSVWATDKLNVNISGSGSVSYKGSPEVEVDISGSGSLSKF